MLGKIAQLFGGTRTRRTDRPRNFKPSLEALEGRDLPSIGIGNGDLHIGGTPGNDHINVWASGSVYVAEVNGQTHRFDGSRLWGGEVFIRGGGGDDYIRVSPVSINQLRVWAYGESGNDTIIGSVRDDTLYGGTGHDQLLGEAGNDYLNGGQNSDPRIDGGSGNDTLVGGHGHDRFQGGSGNDYFDGGDHNDVLLGGSGHDTLSAGAGNDYLDGGQNSDPWIDGGSGSDTLFGGHGHDKLLGRSGVDYLIGGDHNDALWGGDGDDFLWAGSGNDFLDGGDDNDELAGGTGNDRLIGGHGNDRLFGEDGIDALLGWSGADYINGGAHSDRILVTPDAVGPSSGGLEITTFDSADVRVTFRDVTRRWSVSEVFQMDNGFARLHERTGNAVLLLLSNGSEMRFERHDSGGTGVLADNNSAGRIRVYDLTFTTDQGVSPAWATAIHEIGHHWDTPGENSPFNFNWFNSQSGYVSWYAQTGPHEDYAETLVAVFLSNSRYDPIDAPLKVAYMNNWLDYLSG